MSLTIVICTHDRRGLLARTLDSLNAATRPTDLAVRILVVANACTDDTLTWLRGWPQGAADALPLEFAEEARIGKSHALNHAIRLLKTPWLAFVDDDHRISHDFLVNIAAAIHDYPHADMFCGRIIPDWPGNEPAWVHERGPYRIYPLPVPNFDLGLAPRPVTGEPIPGGGNLVLRTVLFDSLGGFATALGPHGHDLGGSEDSDFVLRAIAAGKHVQYLPQLLQYHYVDLERLRLGYLLRKGYQRSRSFTEVRAQTQLPVPAYLWRKTATYLASACCSLSWARTRFYLVRFASALGEIAGHRARNPALLGGALAPLVLMLCTSLFLLRAAPAQLAVTATFTLLLTAKSLRHFTRTGPALRTRVTRHFRAYSAYAVARLGLWAFLIANLLAWPGSVIHRAWSALPGATLTGTDAALLAALSLAMLGGTQFTRLLLLRPSTLAISYQYRLSRLYPLWRRLTPARLRYGVALITGLGTLALSIPIARLAALSHWPEVLGLGTAIALPLALCLTTCWRRRPPTHASPTSAASQPLNLLMIGCDTLRADRLGGLGYPRSLTPTLDRLAARGTHFTQCYVPLARTAPSLATLLTGVWPHHHGVRENFVPDSATRLNVPTLPRHLGMHGYHTLALSDWSGADLAKLDLGFAHTETPPDQWNLKYYLRQGPMDLRLFVSLFTHNRFGRRCIPELYYQAGVPLTDHLGERTRTLLSDRVTRGEPFFLNVFMGTTHVPFGSEYPYYTLFTPDDYAGDSKFVMSKFADPMEIIQKQESERTQFDVPQIIALYDACVRRFDDEVAKIVTHLDTLGLTQRTLIVIYSDHGCDFFENNTWGQGNTVEGSDPGARIPLIIVDPRQQEGQRVNEVVRSVDLAPTLCALLDLPPLADTDGVSLQTLMEGRAAAPELAAFQETGVWLGRIPGQHPEHLRYPGLPDLLEVRDRRSGTLSLKDEYSDLIIEAKDRMIRKGRWKLVYLPLQHGAEYRLYDVAQDPQCLGDLAVRHPERLAELKAELVAWMQQDSSRRWQGEHLIGHGSAVI